MESIAQLIEMLVVCVCVCVAGIRQMITPEGEPSRCAARARIQNGGC